MFEKKKLGGAKKPLSNSKVTLSGELFCSHFIRIWCFTVIFILESSNEISISNKNPIK